MKTSFLKVCSLLFVLFFLTSCSKDDDASPERLITFTVNNDESSFYWVLLSDDAGNVVDWKEVSSLSKREFTYSLKEEVTVTVIRKTKETSNPFYLLQTFTHVEKGDYALGFPNFSSTTPLGNFSITLAPDFQYSNPQSESNCGLNNPDNTNFSISLCENPANLYIPLTKNNNNEVPRYYYDSEIRPGESLTINNELYNQAPIMKSKIGITDNPGSGFVFVEGNTIKKKMQFFSSGYYYSNTKSFPFYYPDLVGTLFSDFNFGIYYSSEKNITHSITKTLKEPAANWPALNANFNFSDSTKVTIDSFSFSTTGEAQYIFTAFNYYETNLSAWWYISTEFSNSVSIKLPSVPDDLKNVAGLSFLSKLKRTNLNLVENNGVGGYSGFYKKALNVTTVYPVSYDIREKMYIFNGARAVVPSGRKGSKGE